MHFEWFSKNSERINWMTFEMQKICPLQCSNEEYGIISYCQMFLIRCVNRNRKATLLFKSWCYEEKRSGKKGKLKKKGRKRKQKTMKKGKKKGKSSRKTRGKIVIQSRTSAHSTAVSSGMADRAKCFACWESPRDFWTLWMTTSVTELQNRPVSFLT